MRRIKIYRQKFSRSFAKIDGFGTADQAGWQYWIDFRYEAIHCRRNIFHYVFFELKIEIVCYKIIRKLQVSILQ